MNSNEEITCNKENTNNACEIDDGDSSSSGFSASADNHYNLWRAIEKKWIHYTKLLRQTITTIVVQVAMRAATYPKITLTGLTILSLSLIVLGFTTNFPVRSNMNVNMSPANSLPLKHSDWFSDQQTSGFHDNAPMLLYAHADGNSILDTTILTLTSTDTTTEMEYDVPLIVQTLRAVFDIINVVRSTPGYNELCELGNYYEYIRNQKNEKPSCRILSITKLWNHDRKRFENEILFHQALYKNNNYDWLIDKLSSDTYPDTTPLFHEAVIGHAVWETVKNNASSRKIVTAESFQVVIELPRAVDFEKQNLQFQTDALEQLGLFQTNLLEYYNKADNDNDSSNNNANAVRIEYFSDHAIQIESSKAIYKDFYLIPFLLVVMIAFTCFIFFDPNDPVKSRCLVGIGSVITITMSVSNAFGILFLFGVPFTNLTQMILCIVFGVGLDDTFIITGEYYRILAKKNNKNNKDSSSVVNVDDTDSDIINRVGKTMEEVGMSISLTTLTTVVAFILGISSSTIPAVVWLCIYGATAISVDFLYQITYFVAFLVLNERRVRDNKRDCCFWIQVPIGNDDDGCDYGCGENISDQIVVETYKANSAGSADSVSVREEMNDHNIIDVSKNEKYDEESRVKICSSSSEFQEHVVGRDAPLSQQQRHVTERFMSSYADILLRPQCKKFVMLFFLAMTVFNIYSITLFRQEFDIEDYIPKESHIRGWLHTTEEYTSVVRTMGVYFRDIDQSDPIIQAEMVRYIDDLTENLPQIGGKPPATCWFRDLQTLLNGNMTSIPDAIVSAIPQNLDFLKDMTTNQQLDYILSIPVMQEIYGSDIAFANDENGNSYIKSSRCYFIVRNMDYNEVSDQMNLVIDQRNITASQPMNTGDGINTDWSMFAFDYMFLFWETYLRAVKELIFTIIVGIVSVGCATFLLVPHRSAIAITLPMIIVLYINFLGIIRAAGIQINGLTYVLVVTSIGLLVDFLMHILLRYYELIQNDTGILGSSPSLSSIRDICVKKTLETMGSSVLQGGTTTFLAVSVFMFGSTELFHFAFKALSIMIAVGVVHGLVLLPVVLSIFGPTVADNVIVKSFR